MTQKIGMCLFKVADSIAFDTLNSARGPARNEVSRLRQIQAKLRANIRKCKLIKPQAHWAPWTSGDVWMVKTTETEGNQWFCFEYSDRYYQQQLEYHLCVASHDPQSLIALLRHNPYHIDTLLQLAQAVRQSGQNDEATELIEMALYGLESAFHAEFDWTAATSRLSFDLDVNRSIFRALFNYIQVLGRRGAHRSAFECCKLLLSLDPCNDPMHILLLYDYYAIRSRQFDDLLTISTELPWRDLTVIPNMRFGDAIARFFKSELGEDAEGTHPDEALAQALAMFPSFLPTLLKQMNQASQSKWQRLLSQTPFNTFVRSESLIHLVDLCATRMSGVWRESQLNDWLFKVASNVVERMRNANDDLHSYATAAALEYPDGPSLVSHIHNTVYATDAAFAVPDDEFPAFGFQRAAPPAAAADQMVLNPAANALQLFLQSLLPWAVPPPPPQ
eukprot:c7928_g1_i2.p1 GENE.c7928_g1_i2~~c7928_g1_i2.p1  ORF type:complete len:447 (+),score=88.34 c7928_g1_i2:572-1912(+)